jgi:DNA replication protein DnaC
MKDGDIVLNIILAREGVLITTMLTEQEVKELLSASQAIIDRLEAMRQTKEQEA